MRATSRMAAALLAAAPGAAALAEGVGTSSASAEGRPYTVSAGIEFRMLAVSDEDPANDRGLFYRGELGWRILPELSGFIRLGVSQAFVEVGTAPAVRFQDLLVGARYKMPVKVADEQVDLGLRLGVYLPTSRASQRQTLFGAPDLGVSARWAATPWMALSMGVLGQYRFVHFAERDGPGGLLNTQLVLGGSVGVELTAYEGGEGNDVTVSLSASTTSRKRYEAADTYESAASDATYWDQLYGWSAAVSWTPLEWLTASVGLEQGGPVLRDGIVNVFFTKLEETELVIGVSARY